MRWNPHPYQETALKFMLKHPAAGLLIDMGLGKTSITLAAFSVLQQKRIVEKALVIAPLRVVYGVWGQEVEKWDDFAHLSVSIVHGNHDQRKRALDADADIYVTNPENTVWLAGQRFKKADMLVCDESTKYKAPRTQRSMALKGMLQNFTRRYILTGTPAPNGLMDLFGQIYILDQGERLGRFITHYRNTYFFQTGYGGYTWKPMDGADELIHAKISDIALRMDAKDYLDMPDVMHVSQPVQLPPKARKVYDQVEKVFMAELEDGEVTAFNAAAKSTKLRQIANGRVYKDDKTVSIVHDAKVRALADLIEQMQGNPLLVAYEFQHDRDAIVELTKCPTLGGGTSTTQQRKILAAWDARELPVLAVHPASAGHGLNLQRGGHHICWFGLTWNLELYDQLIARIWRQGQTERVFNYHLVAQDTLDETVLKALGKKDRTQRMLLDALKKKLRPAARRRARG